ncbi:MAG: response regulator transcription factor [Bacteroidetes bacterium]|nr:response regulator transcription factor [Bacteroidota bacterium]
MKKPIKIAVAEDQVMFRSGLVSMLNDLPNVQVFIEVGTGNELLAKMRTIPVDVIFLDYRMPDLNGVETAKIIRTQYPEVRMLMLSMYDDPEFIISALENGVCGYLTKDDEPEEISLAIVSVLNTGYYLNDRTSKILIGNLVNEGKVNPSFPEASPEVKFTEIEISVMTLIAQELSNKEIASKLSKAERTIEGYRTDIMEKTGARNSVGIVMYGIKKGIIQV